MNRAQLPQSNMLLLSIAHLSPKSQDWLERHAEDLEIFENGEGFIYSPEAVLAKIDPEDIPLDLLQLGAFAQANRFDRLCIEHDAPAIELLPVYEQKNVDPQIDRISTPGRLAQLQGTETLVVMQPGAQGGMIEHAPLDVERLLLDPGVTKLEDGDYEATDDGVWIGIKEASIRIHSDKHGVNVDILARGCEDEEPLGSAQAHHYDLRDVIAERKRAAEEAEGPEM